MSTVNVCVDRMQSQFGSLTFIGFAAICVFAQGASNARNFPVAPESKIDVADILLEGD
jgi:hypothetical protein